MSIDIELMRRQNFFFGAKLVRGAYMEQERLRAKEVGYQDPINESYQATTQVFNETIDYILNQIIANGVDTKKICAMIATHNEDTVAFAINR